MFSPSSSLSWVICAKILLSSLETSWCFALYREKTVELNLEMNIGIMYHSHSPRFSSARLELGAHCKVVLSSCLF